MMLSIRPTNPQKCTPHLLPARINHNGPINDTQRYFKPEADDKGIQHVHFRGRHLHGTRLSLPENYTGSILRVTDDVIPQDQSAQRQELIEDQEDQEDEDEDMAQEEIVQVKVAEQVGEFDEIIIWGHGGPVDGQQDVLVRGMEEWIEFAEKMHVDEEDEDNKTAAA